MKELSIKNKSTKKIEFLQNLLKYEIQKVQYTEYNYVIIERMKLRRIQIVKTHYKNHL